MFGHISPERVYLLLTEILASVHRIEKRIAAMSDAADTFEKEIAELTAAVEDTEGAEASAQTALNAIPGMIEAAIQKDRAEGSGAQLAALSGLVARLRAGIPGLASAVAASKPAGSAETPPAGTGDSVGGATAGTGGTPSTDPAGSAAPQQAPASGDSTGGGTGGTAAASGSPDSVGGAAADPSR